MAGSSSSTPLPEAGHSRAVRRASGLSRALSLASATTAGRARGAGWPELRACVRMRLLPHVCVRVCTAPCHTSCVAACFWVRGSSPASWRQTGLWVRGGVGDLASHDRGVAWDWPMRSQEVSPRGPEISSLACRAGLCYSGDRVGSDSCARAAPVLFPGAGRERDAQEGEFCGSRCDKRDARGCAHTLRWSPTSTSTSAATTRRTSDAPMRQVTVHRTRTLP